MDKNPPDIRFNENRRHIKSKSQYCSGCSFSNTRKAAEFVHVLGEYPTIHFNDLQGKLLQCKSSPVVAKSLPHGKHISLRGFSQNIEI